MRYIDVLAQSLRVQFSATEANAKLPYAWIWGNPWLMRKRCVRLIAATGMRFSVSGEVGQAVQVQRSSDLVGWQDWFGVVLGSSASELNDPDTAFALRRFYRAVAR